MAKKNKEKVKITGPVSGLFNLSFHKGQVVELDAKQAEELVSAGCAQYADAGKQATVADDEGKALRLLRELVSGSGIEVPAKATADDIGKLIADAKAKAETDAKAKDAAAAAKPEADAKAKAETDKGKNA